MSCPEVVYQAYYPYLYQRPSTSSARPPPPPFPPFAHHPHYDRVIGAGGSSGGGSSSSSSVRLSGSIVGGHDETSTGAEPAPPEPRQFYSQRASSASPPSPPQAHRSVYTDDDEESGGSSRAQYVSANCVVFTHYTGDVAAVVDEHFTRALATDTKPITANSKDWSPMTSRNFPPSFWNSNSSSSSSSAGEPTGYHGAEPSMYHCATTSEPWHSHYQQYHHHRAVHEYHQHNMQYGGGLLLPAHQYKEAAGWHPQHRLHDPTTAHHLDAAAAAAYSAYPSISDLESQVQESSKDLYWF
ncbi:transcription factor vestigial isoform X2 [Rhodnius prolixus]|uniref:transcription factor vestigial isoform X2 n=1 Tax=Rhodnius prolixus TaxID=13249 RepID=UPI003D18DD29